MAKFKDCPVVPDLGTEDPNNVFECRIEESCCTVDLKPACCAKKEMSTAIVEQLHLWGTVFMIIGILALFTWWCRTDEACCDVEKPCLYRYGCKKHRKKEEEEQEVTSSQLSLKSSKSAMTVLAAEAPPPTTSANNDDSGHEEESPEMKNKEEEEKEGEVAAKAENLEANLEPDGKAAEPADDDKKEEDDDDDDDDDEDDEDDDEEEEKKDDK